MTTTSHEVLDGLYRSGCVVHCVGLETLGQIWQPCPQRQNSNTCLNRAAVSAK